MEGFSGSAGGNSDIVPVPRSRGNMSFCTWREFNISCWVGGNLDLVAVLRSGKKTTFSGRECRFCGGVGGNLDLVAAPRSGKTVEFLHLEGIQI